MYPAGISHSLVTPPNSLVIVSLASPYGSWTAPRLLQTPREDKVGQFYSFIALRYEYSSDTCPNIDVTICNALILGGSGIKLAEDEEAEIP